MWGRGADVAWKLVRRVRGVHGGDAAVTPRCVRIGLDEPLACCGARRAGELRPTGSPLPSSARSGARVRGGAPAGPRRRWPRRANGPGVEHGRRRHRRPGILWLRLRSRCRRSPLRSSVPARRRRVARRQRRRRRGGSRGRRRSACSGSSGRAPGAVGERAPSRPRRRRGAAAAGQGQGDRRWQRRQLGRGRGWLSSTSADWDDGDSEGAGVVVVRRVGDAEGSGPFVRRRVGQRVGVAWRQHSRRRPAGAS